jgi:RNA polymerase sigma factor (sigma-70 family)
VNKIYFEISKLSGRFRKICYKYTKDREQVDDAVQELYLYFLQMNPDTLKKIYHKDGLDGITGYGTVVLRRALTSPRSPFYYKYKKYYTNLAGVNMTNTSMDNFHKSIYNLPQEEEVENIGFQKLDKIDAALSEMYWYDRKVFELYYYEEGNTLDSLAKKTGISRNSLFTTIDKVRTLLKSILNE